MMIPKKNRKWSCPCPPSVNILLFVLILLTTSNSSGGILPARSQITLPCPVPGLENVMETQDDCDCFYASALSNTEEFQDFDSYYTPDSVLHYPRAGIYTGPDAIREYLVYVLNGVFLSVDTPLKLFPRAFMYSKATAPGQCKLFYAAKVLINFNPEFTIDHQEACMDITVGLKLDYSLTGNDQTRIAIKSVDVWTNDIFVASLNSITYGSPQTAKYVCDKIVNTCEDYSIPERKLTTAQKEVRKNGNILSRIKMRKCLREYNALPGATYPSDGTIISYADGDAKACRALHSFMTTLNLDHCPHISFEREVDVNGKYKCSESAFIHPDAPFTSEEIDFLEFHGVNTFGYPEDSPGGRVLQGACPFL